VSDTHEPALTAVSPSVPECLECGACCFNKTGCYVLVRAPDHERLGPHAERLVEEVPPLAFMRMADGHCAALNVDPELGWFCSVYEVRPRICREFERGSPECALERAEKRHLAVIAMDRVKASR
jgi:Fe-S-cluster containining protein